MTKVLTRDGWKITHKRVERVMRASSLICRGRPRFVHISDSKQREPGDTNVMKELTIEALRQ